MEEVTDESGMTQADVIDKELSLNTNNVKINSSNEENFKVSVNENISSTSAGTPLESGLMVDKGESLQPRDVNREDPEGTVANTTNSTPDFNNHFHVRKEIQVENGETERCQEMPYKCGVCLKSFPDITNLHEHMINDEKVKGYKYNTEDKTASIVDGYQNDESRRVTGKKRGRKRKKEDPDEDWGDGRYVEYIPIKVEVDSESEINDYSLVKFEKTIESKRSNSAFFDPVSHRYGTRRSSFLKLNKRASPKKGEGNKLKQKKTSNGNKTDKDEIVQADVDIGDIDEGKTETDVAIEENLEADQTDPDNTKEEARTQANDIKPDGTMDIDPGDIESDEVNSAEEDSEYEPSEPESDHDEPSDPESDPSWDDLNEEKSIEKRASNASHSVNSKFTKRLKLRQSTDHRKKGYRSKKKRYKCKTCGRVLKSKVNASKHRTLHLLKEETAEFEEIDATETETVIVENEETNNQKERDTISKTRDVENTNCNEQEEKGDRTDLFSCPKCDAAFSDKKDLKEHELTTHRRKIHKCDICQRIFSKLYRLEEHIDTFHSEENFECEICNLQLPNRGRLWSHKGCHLDPNDKYFSEEIACKIREEYKARIQSRSRPDIVQCTVCGKEVVSKRLVRHMHSHNTSKDFECEICHKRFTNKRYVRDHITKSHGSKTSTCHICGRTFKGTSYLEKHKQTHGPKDKICTVCGRGFTTDFYLRIHMVTHTEEKQFKCNFCKAAFKHKARLDIHVVERHTKGQDRPCKYCGQLFPSRHKARLHERKVHEGHIQATVKPRQPADVIPKVVKVQNVKGAKYKDGNSYPNQVTLKIDEDAESVEQIIEIPENSQQCQLMILPNGVIKVLNVIEESSGPTVTEVEEEEEKDNNNITVQYLSEDGSEVIGNGDAQIQYIEVDESEFNLLTQNKDPSTHIVEIVDRSDLN